MISLLAKNATTWRAANSSSTTISRVIKTVTTER
ncbi:Uncharacterised protein [Mycobacterium tuberculosis]|nr:Uncharacterised protein [Mycobacterium tuberculosis]